MHLRQVPQAKQNQFLLRNERHQEKKWKYSSNSAVRHRQKSSAFSHSSAGIMKTQTRTLKLRLATPSLHRLVNKKEHLLNKLEQQKENLVSWYQNAIECHILVVHKALSRWTAVSEITLVTAPELKILQGGISTTGCFYTLTGNKSVQWWYLIPCFSLIAMLIMIGAWLIAFKVLSSMIYYFYNGSN